VKLEEIQTPVTALSGVKDKTAAKLARLGVYTVGDLLAHYPRDWDDRTVRLPLAEYGSTGGQKVHTIAQVMAHLWFGYGKTRTLKIKIADETAEAELVAFNRPFLEKMLPVGAIIAVTGNFDYRYNAIQSTAFETELIAREGSLDSYGAAKVPGSGVFPVYPLTEGVTQGLLRPLIQQALHKYGRGIEGDTPSAILAKRGLMSKQDALWAIHCPRSYDEAQSARKSLIYEELYRFQCGLAKRVKERRALPPVVSKADFSPRQKKLLKLLPFTLTDGQLKAIAEINADIDAGYKSRNDRLTGEPEQGAAPVYTMARLLQGDVGSGKTMVAFFACLRTADWGGQSALLAPTEILARQHAENAAALLAPTGVRLAYLTGNLKAQGRGPLLKALAEGGVDLVIGTHALFSKAVQYRDLQLAIIDEQHRFGVLQRNAIIEKGRKPFAPHLMMMSATPIPRTLALTVFGDLDVSVIAQMPAGRLPIKTLLARMGNEQKVYDYVRRELAAGHQAYFVYPRIEETDEDDTPEPELAFAQRRLKGAEEMYAFLSGQVYPEFPAALIHSKTGEDEQAAILDGFKQGKIKILVATSVVEVGVDNPNATCMVIEHADRFGLAALHQLRGRVGRGSAQSYCFLVYGAALSETGKERMKALRETTDGFIIAEEDLRLRGPGEMSGIQQSGYLTLGIADPIRDRELLEMAREDVFENLPGGME
jgi:ATP-dependent DNA helicase RecG